MNDFLSYDPHSANLLSFIGPIYDIAGAALVARALIWIRADKMAQQADARWDVSDRLIKMFAEQKVDGWFGLTLLVIGFTMQAASGIGFKSTELLFGAAASAPLAALAILYFACGKRLTKITFVNAIRTKRTPEGTRLFSDSQIETFWQES